MNGTLYGLGVGPGDPDLITLKALKILERAPVIAYPAPDVGDSLARSIAQPRIPDGREEIVGVRILGPDGRRAHTWDIGRDLGRAQGTVRVQIHRGLDLLRKFGHPGVKALPATTLAAHRQPPGLITGCGGYRSIIGICIGSIQSGQRVEAFDQIEVHVGVQRDARIIGEAGLEEGAIGLGSHGQALGVLEECEEGGAFAQPHLAHGVVAGGIDAEVSGQGEALRIEEEHREHAGSSPARLANFTPWKFNHARHRWGSLGRITS